MTRNLVVIVTLFLPAAASAYTHGGRVELVANNFTTFDPSDGSPVLVDVYHLLVENPLPVAVTSAGFTLPGHFIDNFDGNFRQSPDLPLLFGHAIADSFIVTPPGNVLAGREVFNSNGIDVAYTLAGDTDLIPANSEGTVVATLAVDAGVVVTCEGFDGDVFYSTGSRGRVVFTYSPTKICIFPEPSTALLAALALAGCAAPRRALA